MAGLEVFCRAAPRFARPGRSQTSAAGTLIGGQDRFYFTNSRGDLEASLLPSAGAASEHGNIRRTNQQQAFIIEIFIVLSSPSLNHLIPGFIVASRFQSLIRETINLGASWVVAPRLEPWLFRVGNPLFPVVYLDVSTPVASASLEHCDVTFLWFVAIP